MEPLVEADSETRGRSASKTTELARCGPRNRKWWPRFRTASVGRSEVYPPVTDVREPLFMCGYESRNRAT